MGFQHLRETTRRAAQSKGGKIRISKGIGRLSPERRKEIASMGGKAKHANRSKADRQTEESESPHGSVLERILDNIGEQPL